MVWLAETKEQKEIKVTKLLTSLRMELSGSSSSLDSLDLDAQRYHQRRRQKAYRKLILAIADYLDDGDVEKIAWRYNLSKKSKGNSSIEVLNLLHGKGELSETRVSELKEMLEELNQHKLVHEYVKPFQEEFQDYSKSEVTSVLCTGSGTSFGVGQSTDIMYRATTQSSFENESNTSTHTNTSGDPEVHFTRENHPIHPTSDSSIPEAMSQPTSLSTSHTSSSLDMLSETSESRLHGTPYHPHLETQGASSQKVHYTASLPPTPSKGAEALHHNIRCPQRCPVHQRRSLHESLYQGGTEPTVTYEDEQTREEMVHKQRPQSSNSSYGRAVKRREAFLHQRRPRSWAVGCTCPKSNHQQYSQQTLEEIKGHTNSPVPLDDLPEDRISRRADFERSTETQRQAQNQNSPVIGHHGVQVPLRFSHSLEDLAEHTQSPTKRSRSLESLNKLSESSGVSTNGTASVPALAIKSSSVAATKECKQSAKKSVLSFLKSSFTRSKLISPGKELTWTEKIEYIQKYIYTRKLQARAITCPAKLEIDGKGHPNLKLCLHLHPYGKEEDRNKNVTLEVEIETQKKTRLPSSAKLALTVIVETMDKRHCPQTVHVQEDARLTFFYVKGVISHDFLKNLDSEHMLVKVQAEIILVT